MYWVVWEAASQPRLLLVRARARALRRRPGKARPRTPPCRHPRPCLTGGSTYAAQRGRLQVVYPALTPAYLRGMDAIFIEACGLQPADPACL